MFMDTGQKYCENTAEALVEGLLEHGRLTLEQLIQRCAAQAGKTEAEVETTLKETFASLVRAHYIERCPAPEPLLTLKSQDEQPKKKVSRTASRSRAAILAKIVAETEEHRILSAAAPMEAERFRVPASLAGFSTSSRDVESADIIDDSAGKKRKRDALEMDSNTMNAVDEKEVLWRVNYEECIRRLRHKLCIAQVRSRLDVGAGTIIAAMLEATRSLETKSKQKVSAPLFMDGITQAVRNTPEGRTMTMERIRGALQQMTSESLGFISRAGEGGSFFVVNLQRIIELAQRSEVEGIVLQRYGRESCRIFRLLSMKGHLEQKQISDRALVPLKETWELLFKLLKEEFVELQEISKAPDHAPSKTFYLWRVNLQGVLLHVLDDMYHAAANLGQRLAHELDQEQEILGLLKQLHQSKSSGADGKATHVTLTQAQHEQVKRIRRVATVLENSILKLDDAIMLFHDF
ncbi:hypothetical protein O6H91_Y428400 [Diphasiastrum complanatum]|nr:hypothetical protein O6H91_Y428400 [Diphasiastrum complanatum]